MTTSKQQKAGAEDTGPMFALTGINPRGLMP